ncbi:hypothetical protein PhCBS80983_g04017 [Powellomyces hirtus]|uniref:Uncharacterized protein n=1 Tax=Powellomyces hirtus TaxID=109895 RepID=A0A507E039_9FUNG|nr:hypothetical protein PhCBS80983_g04017 [Powellomyces hirtus]
MPQPSKQYKPDPAGRRKKAPQKGSPRPPVSSATEPSSPAVSTRRKREVPETDDLELRQLDAIQNELLSPNPEQALLNLILSAFDRNALTSEEAQTRLRTIKALFFNRDYVGIFTNQDLLPVYASEYIPGRALCYRRMFMEVPELRSVLKTGGLMVCLGAGNGSELVGVAAAMLGMHKLIPQIESQTLLRIHLQDLSDYGQVRHSLETAIREHYSIPPSRLQVESSCADLLSPTAEQLAMLTQTLSSAKITTAFFLLNELLSTNKSSFVKFISLVLRSMAPDSFLLVADSAGSFSECSVGKREYMVYQLLDAVKGLEPVVKEDAVWYRYPETVQYPSKIQNMRYFLRLYRRVDPIE